MIKLDLHIHSKYSSDGLVEPKIIIETAIERDLDGIAICDHNVFESYEHAKMFAPEGFILIPGAEYSTDAGHVLALFVTKRYDLPLNKALRRSIDDLRREADLDGALLIAAHPFRRKKELHDRLIMNVDGMEAENSRDSAAAPENSKKVRDVALKHNRFITGGSDAHIVREIGASFTTLPDDTERTPEGVKEALLAGLSDAVSLGSKMRYQAIGKMHYTYPKRFMKDFRRLINYTARDFGRKNGRGF